MSRFGTAKTKPWVVELLLDLTGYSVDADLVDAVAIEPAADDGAFLVQMAERLISSCRQQKRDLQERKHSIIAYELNDTSAAKKSLLSALAEMDVPPAIATDLASSWVRTGDYLFEAFNMPHADFVIGNPPYVRLEDIPEEGASAYRKACHTMTGRADL